MIGILPERALRLFSLLGRNQIIGWELSVLLLIPKTIDILDGIVLFFLGTFWELNIRWDCYWLERCILQLAYHGTKIRKWYGF